MSQVWHPYTQHALEPPMQCIIKAEGAHLINDSNERILDAISSWWVVTHGHRHPHITQSIKHAADHLDQIIFAEYTHDYAERLATALLHLAPSSLQYVFYTDSGSTAVEVAIKMALGFYKYNHQSRSRIVVMQHGYHGDTVGTMSVGERGVYNAIYEPLLFAVDRIPFPVENAEQQTLDAFEALCKQGDVAALLIEPLVLAAGGFKFYSTHVLRELKKIAVRYQTLLILDEVMTGWGRTGTLFAAEQGEVLPDILCTSKGLTNGALPLAATLCTAEIYRAHFSPDRSKTFFHSSSYTANPIACSAALANIEIWQNEPVLSRIKTLEKWQNNYAAHFLNDDRFMNVRQLGTIVALDVRVKQSGYLSAMQPLLRAHFRHRQILIRPLGNVIYVMPPYCVSHADLAKIYTAIDEVVLT